MKYLLRLPASLLMACLVPSCIGWNHGKITRSSSQAIPTEHPNLVGVARSKCGVVSKVAFIEYDSRGRTLQADQVTYALRELASVHVQRGWKLLVVHYVHGWKNGALSGDADQFQRFIAQLGSIGNYPNKKIKVLGIYHAWPGAPFSPLKEVKPQKLAINDELQPLQERPLGWLLSLPQELSIWERWWVAGRVGRAEGEDAMSGVIQRLNLVTHEKRGGAILIGHSMGGLISELAVVKRMAKAPDAPCYPDLVFLMNAASQAVEARYALETLNARGMAGGEEVRPKIFAITSKADWATGMLAPVVRPVLLPVYAIKHPRSIPTPSYLLKCPGHHQGLISYDVEKATWEKYGQVIQIPLGTVGSGKDSRPVNRMDWLVEINLWPHLENGDTQKAMGVENKKISRRVAIIPPATGSAAHRKAQGAESIRHAEVWQLKTRLMKMGTKNDLYPVVSVDTGLIDDHCDIWDTQAVSVLVAAIRMSGILSK